MLPCVDLVYDHTSIDCLQATFAEQKVFKFVWLCALFCHFAKPTTTLAVKKTEVNVFEVLFVQ